MSNIKQRTAGNDHVLKSVKADWNAKIYKAYRTVYNESGYDDAQRYLQQFTTAPVHLTLPTAQERGYFAGWLAKRASK